METNAKTLKMYAVTFALTNDFGVKNFNDIPLKAYDPDDVCSQIETQIRGVCPRPDLKIIRIVEDFAEVE